jgi:hypothetical protein
MHPVIMSQIAAAQIADRQRQAERQAIAQAARRAHRSPAPQRLRLAAALACRVLGPLAVCGRAMQLRPRPLPACPPTASCTSCA